jgi:hypothetical protein
MRTIYAAIFVFLGLVIIAPAHADWYGPFDKLPTRPTIEISAPTGHLGSHDRWCDWVQVTITNDYGGAYIQRMFGCEPPFPKRVTEITNFFDKALLETGKIPPKGSCSGRLMQDTEKPGAVYFIEEKGDACIFHPHYNSLVLKTCKIGHNCTIYGSISNCIDEDECVAITRITHAKL